MSKKNDTDKFIWDDVVESSQPMKKSSRLIDEFENGFSQPKQIKSQKPRVKKVQVARKVKKNRIKSRITKFLILVIALLIFFAPLIRVDEISLGETDFTSKQQFMESSGINEGNAISIYDLVRINIFYQTETISGADTNYEFKTKSLNVVLDEITPLAINANNELYYVYDEKIEKSSTLKYPAPTLQGFSAEKEEALVSSMKDLDYDVIKEISSIQLVANEISDELVLMQMKDGNYVKIMISQIPLKMPYYNQMSQTIDAVKGGQDGIIHLDRGDYYEPI